MDKILAAFHLDDPASLKRAIVLALGGVVTLAVNPFLQSKGIPGVSDTALEMFAGLVATFLLQSGLKSAAAQLADAKAAGATAAATIVTPADAAAKLGEAAKP